jgi:hypothetical protein
MPEWAPQTTAQRPLAQSSVAPGFLYGYTAMLDDCKTARITAAMAVYLPRDNPFEGSPLFVVDLGEVYGYRFTLP